MKPKDWIYAHLFPPLLWAIVHGIFNTLKIRSVGEEKIRRLNKDDKRIVYVFWHGKSFFLIKYMAKRNISIISSTSRDGRLMADILQLFRYGVIYGSSDKSPIRVIIKSIQEIKSGKDVAFSVDGPKGPYHVIKPGALYLAKKTDAYIVPADWSASPCRVLRAWDRYTIPLPFARTAIVFGEPIRLSTDFSEKTIQKETRLIESELNRLTHIADRMTGYLQK